MTKRLKQQLKKTAELNIKDLNILLTDQLQGLFKKMKSNFTNDNLICPICGSKMRYQPLKSDLRNGNSFYCDTCGKFNNPFDLFFSYQMHLKFSQSFNSEVLKKLDYELKKEIFDLSMKLLFKMVANKMLDEKTDAESKIRKIKSQLKNNEELLINEKMKDLGLELKYGFEKLNKQYGTNFKSDLEIIRKSNILDEKLLKFELSKQQLKDLYFLNPSLYALKNFNFIPIRINKDYISSYILERKVVDNKYPNKYSVLKYDNRNVFFNIDSFKKTNKSEIYIVEDIETIFYLKDNLLEYENVVASMANNYTLAQKMSLLEFFNTKFYICFKNENLSNKLKADLEKYDFCCEILTYENFLKRKANL